MFNCSNRLQAQPHPQIEVVERILVACSVPSARRDVSLVRLLTGKFYKRTDPRLIGFTAIASRTFFKVRVCDVFDSPFTRSG
jgi:hypothetical protein